MQLITIGNVSYWDKVTPPGVRCLICHPENDEIDPEDGLRPSQLRRVHACPYVANDRGYEAYLKLELELATEARRKEKRNAPSAAATIPPEVPTEDDAMKLRNVTMAAALGIGSSIAAPTIAAEAKQAVAKTEAPRKHVAEPVWPDNGIAQREVGDGTNWLEDLFVEHVDGKWIAWAVMRPPNGETKGKALNFFTGEVLEVTGDFDGQYVESFIDAKGIEHRDTSDLVFHFKDPRPGGGLGEIDFSAPYLEISRGSIPSIDLRTYRREAKGNGTVIWSKVPMYRCARCPDDDWDAFFSTALDLRDGTMLVSGGKYVFRLRMDDFSPVGKAPALHIFEEVDVQRAIDDAKARQVDDVFGDVLKTLHLD